MDETYIRVEIKGKLTDGELKSLRVLLQNTADNIVQGLQDFYTDPPGDEL